MATMYIRNFPEDLQHRVKVQVAKERTTLRELVMRLITDYLEKAESAGIENNITKRSRQSKTEP
jgi:hypothetical protein